MGLIKLAIDRQNKKLVSYGGSVTDLPPLYETNEQEFRIQIVDPTSGNAFRSEYSVVDCSASSLRVVLAASATGDAGDETENLLAAAYEGAWTYDPVNNWYEGVIDFNTAELAGFIGQAAARDAILEVNLITDGTPETIYSHRDGNGNFRLSANCDEGGEGAPSILTEPTTMDTLFIQDGVGGVTIADNVVTIDGLDLAETPAAVFVFINAPSGSGPIFANLIRGTITTAGFSFIMSAVPENNNYTFTYVLAF